MLKGRLGLETAQIPHADRHGLVWLERGKLHIEDGNLTFVTAGTNALKAGSYQIPFQTVSNILMGPGTTISHDAVRLLARHNTGLLMVGENGVRLYASMPFGPDRSELARRQVQVWTDPELKMQVIRKMYSMRLGEEMPEKDLDTLRGIEGHRMKELYRRLAESYGIKWKGRRYDRSNPEKDDIVNTAINHAATAVYAAGMIAVACTSTIPQLGFIHESARVAFPLDIADMRRTELTIPIAFESVKIKQKQGWEDIERITRRCAARRLHSDKVIPKMIDDIKELLAAQT